MFSKNKGIEKIFLKSAIDVEIVLFARIYLNLFVNLKDKRIILFKWGWYNLFLRQKPCQLRRKYSLITPCFTA